MSSHLVQNNSPVSDTIIRSIIAGEDILAGNVLTTENNLGYINKKATHPVSVLPATYANYNPRVTVLSSTLALVCVTAPESNNVGYLYAYLFDITTSTIIPKSMIRVSQMVKLTTDIYTQKIDNTHVILARNTTSGLMAQILTISNYTVTAGDMVCIASNASGPCITMIDSTRALIAYTSSSNGYLCIATISGNAITLGTALSLGSYTIASVSTLSTTSVVVAISNGSGVYAVVATISATTITNWSVVTVFSSTNACYPSVAAISSTSALYAYQYTGSGGRVLILSISGSTSAITVNGSANLSSSGVSVPMKILSPTLAVICQYTTGTSIIQTVTISGAVVTVGTSISWSDRNYTNYDIIDSSHLLVCNAVYTSSVVSYTGGILNIVTVNSSTSITVGPDCLFTESYDLPYCCVKLDSTHALIGDYNGTDRHANIRILCVNDDGTITPGKSQSIPLCCYPQATVLDSTHVVICGSTLLDANATGNAIVAKISGMDITLGTQVTLSTTRGYMPKVQSLDSTRALVSTSGQAQVLTISDTVISLGSVISLKIPSQLQLLDSTHVMAYYVDTDYFRSISGIFSTVLTINGSTITLSPVKNLITNVSATTVGISTIVSATALDSTHSLLMYTKSSTPYGLYTSVLTLSGSGDAAMVTAGVETVINVADWANANVIPIDATHVLLTTSSDSYGQGIARVLTIRDHSLIEVGSEYLYVSYTSGVSSLGVQMDSNTILLCNYASNADAVAQLLTVYGQEINGYRYNYGVALSNAVKGGPVSVLVEGTTTNNSISLPIGTYYNINGVLTSGEDTETHLNVMTPPPSTENGVIKALHEPYAAILSSNEIKILHALSKKGSI